MLDKITDGSFGMITERITARASDKIPQLSKHKMLRVLAIVPSQIGANALLSSTLAAENVLASEKSSAFLREGRVAGEKIAQRKRVSAILLISVAGDRTSVRGILLPEPRYPLNINAFPESPS